MLLKSAQVPTLTQSLVIAILLFATAFTASAFKPTKRLADQKPKINLAAEIPAAFGDWTEDTMFVPVLPNPEVQAKLDVLYSSTLARTYRNKEGQRVMLSIAYGSDQSSEATSVHRPEFCYSAQGFKVSNLGEATLDIGNRHLLVQRLYGVLGQRREPITYWITMDETTTLPGLDRKLAQMRYGLRGEIPDGLLFRVSSLAATDAQSFQLQDQFLNDLAKNMPAAFAPRYFGKSN